MPGYQLTALPGEFAITRLGPHEPIPAWACRSTPMSLTRTAEELSLVCRQEHVPLRVAAQRDWRCLMVHGPLDFSLTGVLAELTAPLAAARVPVFALSTYDTDYLLVPAANLSAAVAALSGAGHSIDAG